MANAWQHPKGYVCDTGQVGAVVNWRKVGNKEEFHASLRRASWETNLPELVFRPLHREGQHKPPVVETQAQGAVMRLAEAALPSGTANALSSKPQKDRALVKTIFEDALSRASGWAERGLLRKYLRNKSNSHRKEPAGACAAQWLRIAVNCRHGHARPAPAIAPNARAG